MGEHLAVMVLRQSNGIVATLVFWNEAAQKLIEEWEPDICDPEKMLDTKFPEGEFGFRVWEGTYVAKHNEDDFEAFGEFRELTDDEWAKLKVGESVWGGWA